MERCYGRGATWEFTLTPSFLRVCWALWSCARLNFPRNNFIPACLLGGVVVCALELLSKKKIVVLAVQRKAVVEGSI